MLVTIQKQIPIEKGFEAVRNAVLENAGSEDVYFYKKAKLYLADFAPEDLSPVAVYLVEKNLETQRVLHKQLLDNYGIDTFHLKEILHLETDNGLVAMIPPYVEVSQENFKLTGKVEDREPNDYRVNLKLALVPDGLHRAYLAREAGETLTCVVAAGLDTITYPYASYPVSWSDVRVYQEVPKIKKFYRRQDPYTFMRPLDALRMLEPAKAEYGR